MEASSSVSVSVDVVTFERKQLYMDTFIHEEYVNMRREMKKQRQQQQLRIQTDLRPDVVMAVPISSPAAAHESTRASASPSAIGSPALSEVGRRASPSFDRLYDYFKPK